jgi:uncharacterized membrane protein YqjE
VSDGTPGPGPAAGLRGALARAGAATIELVRTRIELAALEFTEERERAKRAIVLAVVGGVFLGFAVMSASALVVVVFWDTHRVLAIAGVTAFHALVGGAALGRLRAAQRSAPQPFAATLAELERDRDWLTAGLRGGPGEPR